MTLRRFPLAVVLILVGLLGPNIALGQIQFGQIQGLLTAEDSGKPLPGVTVVVSGPSMQGEQTEFTDNRGHYLVTQLPPGDNYVVRFYFNDVVVERPGIRITQNKTLTVSLPMPLFKNREKKAYVIRERAPNVDTASANTGVDINQELLSNTATRGRSFESVLSLAPGSADVAPRAAAGGDVGVSFSGSSGNENSIIIDGLNTTDLNSGVAATQLHQNFIREINVITGGYQAEYGRATGAVISIVTKSGSNEYHGSVFGAVLPFQASARPVSRLGEAIAVSSTNRYQFDVGFDLGGPIVKDRLWFYVGFAPTITSTVTDRRVRALLPMGDPDYAPPSYLSDPVLLDRASLLVRKTLDLEGRQRALDEMHHLYNWITKLQININPDHNLILSYLGAPESRRAFETRGVSYDGRGASWSSEVDAFRYRRVDQFHDATARYIGKFLRSKLQLDVLYGFHYQLRSELPDSDNVQQVRYRAPSYDPNSIADFENIPECQRRMEGGSLFNPCPVTDYIRSGFGQYVPRREVQRHVLQASLSYYAQFLGSHALKLGFDFEDNLHDNTKRYTGTDFVPGDPFSGRIAWDTSATGDGLRINRGYAGEKPVNFYGQPGVPCAGGRYCFPEYRAQTETRNYAIYLRDSWNVGFLPGLVVNAGLRLELQHLYGTDGSRQIALNDNVAPRVGLAYDPSRKGRSKIYANFGRFYESIPMDMNDRLFSDEGFLRGRAYTGDCVTRPLSPGGRPLPIPQRADGSPCSLVTPRLSGGEYAPVAPGLKGQFIDEVVAGAQYDVGWDVVLGLYYTYRSLGSVVEDLSVDGGNSYFVANPGVEADPDTLRQLTEEAMSARARADADPQNAKLQSEANLARDRLNVIKAAVLFPKAKRDYHAVTFTVTKRLSNRFSILANYTYSRLLGNFPGGFSPYVNQLDPNLSSQYDIIDLTVNRDGPLNNDRPHNLKFTGFYNQPVGKNGTFTASLTYTGVSGRPIQVLGAHAAYGSRQSLILPNGSGGRTPFISQVDLHLGYEHQLPRSLRLSVFADVVNVLNLQEVINVDDEYTPSFVSPIIYGKPQDLRYLTTTDGAPLIVNSNYGQPTAYQAPLYLRFGGRLAF